MKNQIKYKRVLLKITGEALGDRNGSIYSFESIEKLAKKIIDVKSANIEVTIVIGAGNIFRGREVQGTNVNRSTADYMGMLATVMNALALEEVLERLNCEVRVMSSLNISSVAEPFIRRKAIRHLEKDRIVIFAGGTGNPFFTTDSAAALRACELKCEIILKASDVDGIYDRDPKGHSLAKKYKQLSYQQALDNSLEVMDRTAFTLCQNQKIPIKVFNLAKKNSIYRALIDKNMGTLVI